MSRACKILIYQIRLRALLRLTLYSCVFNFYKNKFEDYNNDEDKCDINVVSEAKFLGGEIHICSKHSVMSARFSPDTKWNCRQGLAAIIGWSLQSRV